MAIKETIPRLVQPIHHGANYPGTDSQGWSFILRPGAFFWTRGRLYVGYSWLSTLHHEEEPLWDPAPVVPGHLIETIAGFYQLTAVYMEGPPYFRKYGELRFSYLEKPDDYGHGFLKCPIDQGSIPVHERYVLTPDTYLEAQWLGHFPLLHKSWKNPDVLERKIKRKPSLDQMREVDAGLRESMEIQCSRPELRDKMIRSYAVDPDRIKIPARCT